MDASRAGNCFCALKRANGLLAGSFVLTHYQAHASGLGWTCPHTHTQTEAAGDEEGQRRRNRN